MAAAHRRAFVLLLGGGHARAAAQVLRARVPGALVVEPPVTGMPFFTADGAAGRALDGWYAATDLGPGPPSLLLWHDPGLAEWIPGTDAEFWIAVPDESTMVVYQSQPNVHAVATWDARELARQATISPGSPPAPQPLDPSIPLATAPPTARSASEGPAAVATSTAIVPVPRRPTERRPGLFRRVLDRLSRRSRAGQAPSLGTLLVSAPAFSVAVVGPPGGGARTGSAAALATVLGEAVRPLGRTVGLVDGHLGDGEAWSVLEIGGSPPTLRDLVLALREGRPAPQARYGGAPTLLLYPESSAATGGYVAADLHRAADHLRRQHVAVVVDLPAGAPDTVDGRTANRAAWLAEADVIVIVTTPDQVGLTRAVGQLQAEWLRGRRVVGCLVGARPGRDQPDLVALFQNFRSHVARLVEMPEDDAGTVALLRRRDADPPPAAARVAYARLAQTVIEVASQA